MVWRLEISTKDPWLVFDVSCVRTNSDDQYANIVELHACVNHCFDDRPSRFYTDFNKLMVLAILETYNIGSRQVQPHFLLHRLSMIYRYAVTGGITNTVSLAVRE